MTHRKLQNREIEFLNILNAESTINSGASLNDGDGLIKFENPFNDFGNTRISVEVKATDNKSFSINQNTLDKIEKQARRIGSVPLLAVDIQKKRYIVLDAQDFMAIMEYLINLNQAKNFIDFVETNMEGETKH